MNETKPKYLILGANGLIGQHVVRLCREKHIPYEGTCYSRSSGEFISFNQLDFEKIPALLERVSPTVVFNAIGLAGGVNFCEENPELGRQYHVQATQVMADWCRAHHAVFVYISTDYVFDGENPPYKEDDPTHPLNLYGQFKLEGENYIRQHLDHYIIARTTNVFGWDPETRTPNFLMHLVQTLRENDSIDSIRVPAYLYGNPTCAADLAAAIMDLIAHHHFGLYHIVGPGYINRYDWALKFIEMAGITNKTIEKLETPPVNMVPRPLKSNLDTSKFSRASGFRLRSIEDGLQLFINDMNHRK
ncbi:MAG: SDR family oxidoreductase [Candidatus Omnitrophota bacterium]